MSSVETGSSLVPRLAEDLLSQAQFAGFLPGGLHSSGAHHVRCPVWRSCLRMWRCSRSPTLSRAILKANSEVVAVVFFPLEEQDNCLDIIRFFFFKEENPILPFLSVELKKKKKKIPVSPVSSWQAAGLPASEKRGAER